MSLFLLWQLWKEQLIVVKANTQEKEEEGHTARTRESGNTKHETDIWSGSRLFGFECDGWFFVDDALPPTPTPTPSTLATPTTILRPSLLSRTLLSLLLFLFWNGYLLLYYLLPIPSPSTRTILLPTTLLFHHYATVSARRSLACC